MRCSYSGRPSKNGKNSHKILEDLNKHSWFLMKMKWEMKTQKNQKDHSNIRALTLAEFLKINDVDDGGGTSTDVAGPAAPASLPVSLPVNLYNRLNRIGLSVSSRDNTESDYNINDNMTPDPREVEVVYNDITKEFNRSLQVSEPNVQVESLDQPEGEDPNNNYQPSRMGGSSTESPTSIRHHLPLATPPERSTSLYNNDSASTSGDLYNNINTVNSEVQTDDVIIINENLKEIMEYITSKNISLETLQAAIAHMEQNNSEASPQSEGMMRSHIMQILEGCSIYNKEIILYNEKVFRNLPEPELKIERMKLAYLKCVFIKMFGPVFGQLSKSLKFDEDSLHPEIPAIEPRTTANRKRRISTVNQQDGNGHTGDGTESQNAPASRRPSLRAQRRSPRASSSFVVPYDSNPQFTQTTRVLELETSYSNAHALNHRDYINNQFQNPRRHYVQSAAPAESPMEYYHTGARMMQPYPQMQFVREQQIPRQYSANYGNNLNYPTNSPEVTPNVNPHVNGVPLPAHVMPSPEQQNYLRMQARRNAMHVSNFTGTWNRDVGPNGHIIM